MFPRVGATYLFGNSNRTMAVDIDLEKKIEALTPDQILTALRRHLDVSQLSFVNAGDFKKAGGK
jgi:zinc protease